MMFDVESALWIGGLFAFALTALLHRIRQRQRRKDAHLYEIPPFLRGTADASDNIDSRFKGNWTEAHPLPKRFEGSDD